MKLQSAIDLLTTEGALAKRRCDVLFAMLRDGTLYDAPAPETA